MSNKPEHTSYFEEIIRKLKELDSELGKEEEPVADEAVCGEIYRKLELPFPPEMFDRLSPDEKETLFIWLNRHNIPQA